MSGPLPPDDPYARPAGASDAEVAASGKVTEALEWVERARGHLYEFHQLLGRADRLFGEAADALAAAGHPALADDLRAELIGRNVLAGRWTFQVVDEYDDGYWTVARAQERAVRDALVGGRRHVHEAEMKERRRTRDRHGHECRPDRPEPDADPPPG